MRCINCFNSFGHGDICPVCGFDISEYRRSEAQLAPGTVLGERYEIGRVIGEGGFGITYAAFDIKLGNKCAIKEYFPRQFSSRDISSSGHTNIKYITGAAQDYSDGLRRFRNEALKLAKFDGVRSVVNVKSYFSENNTGYIVMNFVEGISLKEYLHKNGEKISADSAFGLIKPILSALTELERAGIIHRDISPDNIIIGNNGEPVLIDFGSAREYSADRSTSVILKHGYAPPEQYSSEGLQGPWTDIYALCATIYRMITGIVPADAMERLGGRVKLVLPSRLGVRISGSREKALMKGLAVNAGERWATAEELYGAFYNDNGPDKNRFIKIAATAAAAIFCISAGAWVVLSQNGDDTAVSDTIASSGTESVLHVKPVYADIASGELENGSWYISYDGILNISAQGRLDTDGKIWLKYKDDIKKAVLSDGITEIGSGVFKRLTSLEEVRFPDDLLYIGEEAFAYTALINADIPESVEYIGKSAFEECGSLCSVRLPAALKEISAEVFSGCSALEEIKLPDSLEMIGSRAFYKSGLKSMTLPAGSITLGNNAFGCCDMLESVTLPAGCEPVFSGQPAWGKALSDIFLSEGVTQETAINVLNSLQIEPTSFYNVHLPDDTDIPDELAASFPTYITAVGKSSCPAVKKLAEALYSVELTDEIYPDICINRSILYIDSDEYTGMAKMNIFTEDSHFRIDLTDAQYYCVSCDYSGQVMEYLREQFPDMNISGPLGYDDGIIVKIEKPALSASEKGSGPAVIGSLVFDEIVDASNGSVAVGNNNEIRIYFSEGPKNASAVKKVILGKHVTRLEGNCLSNFANMESIFIPRTVSSISDELDIGKKTKTIYTTPGESSVIEAFAERNRLEVIYVENAEEALNAP